MITSQTTRSRVDLAAAAIGFTFTTLIVSVRFFKQLGAVGIFAYIALVGPAVYLLLRHAMRPVAERIPPKSATAIALVATILITVAAVPLHELANRNALHIPGFSYGNTDIDDALIVGLNALLRGAHPYSVRTWAQSPLTPMPGALLLALPFHLVGAIVLQNAFWLFVLFLALGYLANDRRYALFLWALALASSPKILEEQVLQGADYVVNATYVAMATLLLIHAAQRRVSGVAQALAAAAVGVAFSSRLNFLLLAPLVLSALVRLSGWKRALDLTAVAAAAFTAITAPFYFTSPGPFAPFHTLGKLTHSTPLLTTLGWLGVLAVGTLALWLGLKTDNANAHVYLRNCFAVQLALVAIETALALPGNNAVLTWMYVQYSFFFFPFGFLYFGSRAIALTKASLHSHP